MGNGYPRFFVVLLVCFCIFGLLGGCGRDSGDSDEPAAIPSCTGVAQWAVTDAADSDGFKDVAFAPDGSIVAVGVFYDAVWPLGGTTSPYSGASLIIAKYDASGTGLWAKTLTSATTPDSSEFLSVAVDADGSIYALGFVLGAGTYGFGDGVTYTTSGTSWNTVLVKYDADGNTQWARGVGNGNSDSPIGVAVKNGNVYATGKIYGSQTFDFGNSVTATGASADSNNAVLVKFNASGTAQWAATASAASALTSFDGVAVGGDGSAYVAANLYSTSTVTFPSTGGDSLSFNGTSTDGTPCLLKYNGDGEVIWGQMPTGGNGAGAGAFYASVAVGPDGTVSAAGSRYGTENLTFGAGDNAETTVLGNQDGGAWTGFLVKYDAAGTALWARAAVTETASPYMVFNDIAVGPDGSIYIAIDSSTADSVDFGNGVILDAAPIDQGYRFISAKFSAEGSAQWVKASAYEPSTAEFAYSEVPFEAAANAIAAASDGSVATAGYITGNTLYDGSYIAVGTYAVDFGGLSEPISTTGDCYQPVIVLYK